MFVGNICLVHRAIPPGCSVSLKENKYGEYAASATIHEAMMKNGQCLLLMRGNGLAPQQLQCKSIYSYQNQALNRHCSGNGLKKEAYLKVDH